MGKIEEGKDEKVMGNIQVVGLGPAGEKFINLHTWHILNDAEQICLRTKMHPAVEALEKKNINFINYR